MAYDVKLAQRVRLILDENPGWVEKKMFGGIGYLVNGNMACGINAEQLIVRMSEADYDDALTQPNVHPFDMTGRPMKGWVYIDSAGIAEDKELRAWIERGLRFAESLPPKK